MLATCTVVSYIVFIIRVVKDMAQMLSGASSALDVFQRSGFESRLGRPRVVYSIALHLAFHI